MRTPYCCPVCQADILIYQLLSDSKGDRECVKYVCGKEMVVPVTFGKPLNAIAELDPNRMATYPDLFPNGKYTVSGSQPVKSVVVCGNAEQVIERTKK